MVIDVVDDDDEVRRRAALRNAHVTCRHRQVVLSNALPIQSPGNHDETRRVQPEVTVFVALDDLHRRLTVDAFVLVDDADDSDERAVLGAFVDGGVGLLAGAGVVEGHGRIVVVFVDEGDGDVGAAGERERTTGVASLDRDHAALGFAVLYGTPTLKQQRIVGFGLSFSNGFCVKRITSANVADFYGCVLKCSVKVQTRVRVCVCVFTAPHCPSACVCVCVRPSACVSVCLYPSYCILIML